MDDTDADTFLISTEFAYLLMRFGFAAKGYRALRRKGFALKFHLFLRPQTDFAVSAYPEFLRNLLVPQGFRPFVDRNFMPFARDYGGIIWRLAAISDEPVSVLPYNRVARDLGIWWPLLESAGLSLSPVDRQSFLTPGPVNESLGPVGVSALRVALRRVDRRNLVHRWGLRRAVRKTVLQVTGNFPSESGRFNPMTRKYRAQLWERCRDLNDPIARAHWGEPWDDIFADELSLLPRFSVYRRQRDDADSERARQHDRMARRLIRRINEASAQISAARSGVNLVRWFGAPVDRLADRVMKQIVRGH
ncbi:MAG: hypothetical protein AAF503_04460 [Pseudomonadota bacterium]